MTDPTNTPNPPPIAPSSPGSAQRLTVSTANTPQAGRTTRRTMMALLRTVPVTLLPALLSCNADGTMPTLLDSEARGVSESEPMSEELKRLRKLQEVTWTVDDGTGAVAFNAPATELVPLIFNSCKLVSAQAVTPGHPCSIAGGQPNIASTACGFEACTDAFVHLCTAHEILKIADSLTDVGYSFTESASSIETINVPPQSAPARADLRKQAMEEAKLSLESSFGLLLNAQTSTTCAASPSSVGNDVTKSLEFAPRGLTVGGFVTQQAIDALNVYREAAKTAAYEIVNYADTFRSHPTYSQGVEASMAGEELSRSEAIHILLGGDPGLEGHPGVCSFPKPTPTQEAIIDRIREDGTCPDNFDDEQAIDEIVAKYVALGFSETDIRAALEVLAQQRTAFGVSSTASYTNSEGQTIFTGAMREPLDIDAMYYAGIGRFAETPSVARSDRATNTHLPSLTDLSTATNYADVIDIAGQLINDVLAGAWPAGLESSVVAPLNLEDFAIAAERPGRMKLCSYYGGTTTVGGYDTTDRLLLVVGEDGLKCAVDGNIDGASCRLFVGTEPNEDLVQSELNTPSEQTLGFDKAVMSFAGGHLPYGNRPMYLVRPKSNALPKDPGNYEALAVGRFFPSYCDVVPIATELNRQAGEWLRPNRDWCTLPAEECDGTFFDDRIPLEDELTDDGDGVENSWKHYLALAKQAADEADLLGQQMVAEGLEVDQRAEELELRQHGQDVEATRELEELQTICGTDIDPFALLNHVSVDCDFSSLLAEGSALCSADSECGSNGSCVRGRCTTAEQWEEFFDNCESVENAGPACTSDAQCGTDKTCIRGTGQGLCVKDRTLDSAFNNGNLSSMVVGEACNDDGDCDDHDGYLCRAGRCTARPSQVIQANSTDPALARLEACLGMEGDASVLRAVTPGVVPLCYWSRPGFPNEVCWVPPPDDPEDPGPRVECPFAASKDESTEDDDDYVCINAPDIGVDVDIEMSDAELGYFTSVPPEPRDLTTAQKTCEALRSWRAKPSQALLEQIVNSNLYEKTQLEKLAKYISWEARIGSHSSILIGGASWPLFETGDVILDSRETGVCSDLPCQEGKDGLLCNSLSCDDREERAVLNDRLRDAVLALQAAAYGKDSTDVNLYQFFSPFLPVPAETSDFDIPGASVPVQSFTLEGTHVGTGYYLPPTEAFLAWRDGQVDYKLSGGSNGSNAAAILKVVPTFDVDVMWGGLTPGSQCTAISDEQMAADQREDLKDAKINTTIVGAINPAPGTPNSCAIRDYMAARTKVPVSTDELAGKPTAQLTVTGQGTKTIRLRAEAALDAMELVCEAIQHSEFSGSIVELDNLPEVRSVNELDSVRGYLAHLASQIERAGAHLLLFNFPSSAVDAVRAQSSLGTFPELGGQYGEAISRLRAALIRLSDVSPQIAAQTRQLNYDIEAIKQKLLIADSQDRLNELEFQSTVANHITDCAKTVATISNSALWGVGGSVAAAAATCVNGAFQIGLASDMIDIKGLQSDALRELDLIQFRSQFDTRAEALRELSAALTEAAEEIDAQLASIENLRLSANRVIHRALQTSTYQATSARYVNNALRSRFTTTKERYEQALKYAKRMSILARRSIETRLGLHFADMKDDLSLVEAPYSWAWDVCSAQGIDYNELRDNGEPVNYANRFIGDYVRKLEAVVESYRLKYNFHEGSDTAVVSLRDDVLHVTDDCLVSTENLLFHSGDLRIGETDQVPGWEVEGCAVGSGGTPKQCLSVIDTRNQPLDPGDITRPIAPGLRVTFGNTSPPKTSCNGCGLTTDSRLSQRVVLAPDVYQLSWHARQVPGFAANPTGATSVRVFNAAGAQLPLSFGTPSNYVSGWSRYHANFAVGADDLDEDGTVRVAIVPAANTNPILPHQVDLAALSLTRVYGDGDEVELPLPYQQTTDVLAHTVSACQDTDGDKFRLDRWTYRCVSLCNNGFSGECPQSDAKEYCFMETSFNLSQKQIELGNQLTQSGFARGNFNYRIEDIAVNFVGTDLRSCENSELPQSCFSAGFIPYSLIHTGKYTVRNHMGESFDAKLYEGNIEHARGLATERYLSNPLSDADSSLLSQYMRSEFKGRPLDGEFVIRVWEDDQFSFEKIQDVQLVLKYRYWTRFN